jgi:hypothetical protein
MPRAGFEPPTPATKRPQTYALDRMATGVGILNMKLQKFPVVTVRTALLHASLLVALQPRHHCWFQSIMQLCHFTAFKFVSCSNLNFITSHLCSLFETLDS